MLLADMGQEEFVSPAHAQPDPSYIDVFAFFLHPYQFDGSGNAPSVSF